jgi:zinc protease
MRTCFCWLCILSTILALALLGENAQAQHPDYKTKKLKNGLEIIVVENHMVPLATVELVARNGGFTESPEFSGLSHLYEHMFFKANETYPSQAAFLEGLQSLGASLGVSNATTGTEDVNYFIIIPKRNLARGFEFMSEAIRTPLFDTAEIRKERYVVLGEFDRNEASPLFRIRYAMDSAIWSPELFSRKEQLGLRSTILSATPELMHTIQHEYCLRSGGEIFRHVGAWRKSIPEVVTSSVSADQETACRSRSCRDSLRLCTSDLAGSEYG